MNMDTVINEVAKEFNISVEVLLSKDRSDRVAKARMVLYKVLYMADKSVVQIGHKLNRDHSSVSVGIGKVEKNEKLWRKSLEIYNRLYDDDAKEEYENNTKRRLLYYEFKKLINDGKEGEIENTKENNDIIFKIKHGAQKKVPDYKHSTYRTIYL